MWKTHKVVGNRKWNVEIGVQENCKNGIVISTNIICTQVKECVWPVSVSCYLKGFTINF